MHAAAARVVTVANTNQYDDQFNSPTLNPKWHWGHEPPSYWSLTARPGWLRIRTKSGEDLSDGTTNAPLLLEKAPTGDYEITTHIEMSPTKNFQQGGIVMYGNDGNFCKVVYVYHNHTGIAMGCQENGKYNFTLLPVTPSPHVSGYYLQLDKEGGLYRGYESTDGIHNWTEVASSSSLARTPAVAPASIGLLAVNGAKSSAPQIPADFDFFQERPLTAGAPGPVAVAM
jgi:beta-xylosidase